MRVLSSGSKAPPYTLLSLPFRPPSPVLSDPAITVTTTRRLSYSFPRPFANWYGFSFFLLLFIFLLSVIFLPHHPLPPLLPCPLDSDRCLLVQPPPPLILYFGRNPHCGFKWACESRVSSELSYFESRKTC
uniref:Uncharacterized protein n=1 Tax=Cucumis melo TaxID=3656 RepID=A0A9I9EDG6_CUCME